MVNLVSNLLMDIIAWDTSFWGSIIAFFTDFIGNFGLTIILVTLIVKLVLVPIDYMQRKNARKQAELQKIMQPEIEKIKKKYENVPQVAQQKVQEKQMEIYKKNHYSLVGGCVIMLISMVITVLVFITLFNSLNYIGRVQTTNMYTTLANEYSRVYDETGNVDDAQNAVLELYNKGDLVQSFLWVKNVWRGDKAISPMPTYNEFINNSKYSSNAEDEKYLSEEDYNKVMNVVIDKEKGVNGYYILIILAGVISYLSIAFSNGINKNKNIDGTVEPAQKAGGILKFVLPAIMILFTLASNAVFALYIISNSLFTLCITPIYNKFIDKSNNKPSGNKKDEDLIVDYRIQKNTIIK